MLDLKALLAKILQSFRISDQQQITSLGKSWWFRKVGNIVYVDAPTDMNASVAAGSTVIGTLRLSLRPIENIYLKCTNTTEDVRLIIAPSGTVTFYHPSYTTGARNCGFSGYCYIANGGGI